MNVNNPNRPLTDRLRQEIINAYRRGQSIPVIATRLNLDKSRIVAVILDYIIECVDAINKEGE